MIDDKCGFPYTASNKVINKLEEEKITYQIISKDENPIVKDYKDLNNYTKILSKAIDYVDFRNKKEWFKSRIDEISDIDTLERILKKISDELL